MLEQDKKNKQETLELLEHIEAIDFFLSDRKKFNQLRRAGVLSHDACLFLELNRFLFAKIFLEYPDRQERFSAYVKMLGGKKREPARQEVHQESEPEENKPFGEENKTPENGDPPILKETVYEAADASEAPIKKLTPKQEMFEEIREHIDKLKWNVAFESKYLVLTAFYRDNKIIFRRTYDKSSQIYYRFNIGPYLFDDECKDSVFEQLYQRIILEDPAIEEKVAEELGIPVKQISRKKSRKLKKIKVVKPLTAEQKRNAEEAVRLAIKQGKQDERNSSGFYVKSNQRRAAIGIKDFVVRRSVLRCIHGGHVTETIDAEINILDNRNEQKRQVILAGYCPVCRTYFIMDSIYQSLKKEGIILCRVYDEKSYKQAKNMGTASLAQESILMQYGYSVSQTEGLTAEKRQKILQILMAYDILSANEIISYLNFFMNQRKGQIKYEEARRKWAEDVEFVSHYRVGNRKRIQVHAIVTRS